MCQKLRIIKTSLSKMYGEDKEFSMKLHQIIALAFLPPTGIPGAIDELKFTISAEPSEIMQWFENNYVHGRLEG